MEYINYILQNYGIVMLIMIAIIEVIMYLIKKPIKLLTSKIKNDKVRLIVNKMFILLVFMLSTACYYFGHLWVSQYVDFSLLKIMLTGAFSIVFYSLGDGVFKKVDIKAIDNATRELVQTTQSAIESISKDEIKTDEVISAVDAFNNLCSKLDDDSKK